MKINLKLYAVLGQYLPDHAKKNEAEVEVEDDVTLTAVLDSYGVPPENCHLVLVNGHYVAPSERTDKVMEEGDALAVIAARCRQYALGATLAFECIHIDQPAAHLEGADRCVILMFDPHFRTGALAQEWPANLRRRRKSLVHQFRRFLQFA